MYIWYTYVCGSPHVMYMTNERTYPEEKCITQYEYVIGL